MKTYQQEMREIDQLLPVGASIKNPWLDYVLRLGLIWARAYLDNQDMVKEQFKVAVTPSEQLSFVYSVLVNNRALTKIEELTLELKLELWTEAKEWAAPGTPKEQVIKTAKSIWVINYLIENYSHEQ